MDLHNFGQIVFQTKVDGAVKTLNIVQDRVHGTCYLLVSFVLKIITADSQGRHPVLGVVYVLQLGRVKFCRYYKMVLKISNERGFHGYTKHLIELLTALHGKRICSVEQIRSV